MYRENEHTHRVVNHNEKTECRQQLISSEMNSETCRSKHASMRKLTK